MTRIDITPLEDAAEAMRQAQAEITRLRDENGIISVINAQQSKRIGQLEDNIRAYQADARQRMAQE